MILIFSGIDGMHGGIILGVDGKRLHHTIVALIAKALLMTSLAGGWSELSLLNMPLCPILLMIQSPSAWRQFYPLEIRFHLPCRVLWMTLDAHPTLLPGIMTSETKALRRQPALFGETGTPLVLHRVTGTASHHAIEVTLM